MGRIVITVVADDLTGANATAALLRRQGARVLVFAFAGETLDVWSAPGAPDAAVISVGSRNRGAKEAYRLVFDCVRAAARTGSIMIAKRVDSTLRGNVTAEIRAVLDALPSAIAVVVPSYPDAGRVVVGGYELVGGVPLAKTGAAGDPTRPVATSYVPALLADPGYGVRHVTLDEVTGGSEHVASVMGSAAAEGCRVILADAVSNRDVMVVARAAAESALEVVPVDPGCLTAEMAGLVWKREDRDGATEAASCAEAPASRSAERPGPEHPVLVVAGSTTDLTREQVRYLVEARGAGIVSCCAARLLVPGSARDEEISRVVKECHVLARQGVAYGFESARSPGEVVNAAGPVACDVCADIATSLAEIAFRVLSGGNPVSGLVVTGGDVLGALMARLGVRAIDVTGEVLPLVAAGRLLGGPFDGLPVVSKGGLVGEETTLASCVDHLGPVASLTEQLPPERKLIRQCDR